MSTYKYTFKNGTETIVSTGYNLWNGAKNAGLHILRADPLGTHYLQSTKFENRVRNVWAEKIGNMGGNGIGDLYVVTNKRT